MVRSAWVKPMTLVQKFEANEAVAAETCWYVECEGNYTGELLAHGACKKKGNYTFKDTDGNGMNDTMYLHVTAISVYECPIYTDAEHNNRLDIETYDPQPGQTLWWTHKVWPSTYKHKGTVQLVDASNPNFS